MGNCWSTRVKAESPCSGTRSSRSAVYSRTSAEGKTIYPRTEDEILHSSNLKNFSFTELKNATRNFRPDSVLGEGGFGCVFKGWLDEKTLSSAKPGTGMVIAVKKLNHESFQGHKEWLAEVNYLGQLTHPNLVKLIGFCVDDDQRLLVYEFMPKGSLEHHLFRRNSHFQPLSWAIRVNIAIGAAEGLAYLHDKDVKVIYRDFKPSNILLDSDYSAKLSDFGLAKDGPSEDESHVTTRVMGTYGYAAPEYVSTGHLTSRSDVYSFGVVFLELLTGRKAIDKTKIGLEQNLVEWAKPYLKNPRKVFRILDPKLDGQYSEKLALKASFLASECLSTEPKSRPTMRQVVERLKQLQDLNDMRKPTRDNVQN